MLTDRERAALELMAEGWSNTRIAVRMHVGVRTVDLYIGAVFTKLGIEPDAGEHRRVRAVPAYLGGTR